MTKQLRNESPLELIARHIMDSGQRRKFATLGSNAKSSQELKIILGTSKYFWKSYLKFVPLCAGLLGHTLKVDTMRHNETILKSESSALCRPPRCPRSPQTFYARIKRSPSTPLQLWSAPRLKFRADPGCLNIRRINLIL